MMTDLTHKSVLLTGPMDALTIGVGQALHGAGASVMMGHLPTDEQAAIVAAGQIGARVMALTPDNPDSLVLQVESAGEIDIAVIAPYSYLYKPFMQITDAEWDAAITGNFERALWLSQAVAREWVQAKRGGRIIFLSSIAARLPLTHMIAPGTTLGALRALAKMAAVDLAPHGITVNVIELGWVDTPELSAEPRAHILDGTPTGRLIDPAEVGELCVFLSSDLASSITGETHTLDGGYSLTRSPGLEPLMTNR
jgi:NAD(P)-dependent dehydrogenase (short-subunit alcohol dehydrogenase family)